MNEATITSRVTAATTVKLAARRPRYEPITLRLEQPLASAISSWHRRAFPVLLAAVVLAAAALGGAMAWWLAGLVKP